MKRYVVVFILAVILIMVSGNVALAGPELQGGGGIYYVTWGDTLYSIAARYGVTVEAILRQNGLTSPDLIYVGQPLVIPGQAYGNPGHHYDAAGCANYHTVRAGETLSSIAWDYNVTLQALLQQNNLYNKDVLYASQTICVPGQPGYAPEPARYQNYSSPAPSYYYHTVAAGETLSSIAYRYGVNQWNIVQANNLSNAAYIWSGQRLIIPGYQPQPQYHKPAPTYKHPPTQPQYNIPPPAPAYTDAEEDPYGKPPPYKEPDPGADTVPQPPDYQAVPASSPLPKSEHPITVVVNGGETWADDVYPIKLDPDGITTLIVQTGEELGRVVRVRNGDYEVKGESEFNPEFGAFRFVFRYIPPGDYDVWIDDPDTPSEKAEVEVGAGERVEVAFSRQVRFQGQTFASPDGWVLSAWDNPSKPGQRLGGWSNILVKTPASGLWVMIESEGGGYKAKCFTGSKGPGACDFAALNAGLYNIWIDGTDLTLQTYMDGNAYATFEFGRQD